MKKFRKVIAILMVAVLLPWADFSSVVAFATEQESIAVQEDIQNTETMAEEILETESESDAATVAEETDGTQETENETEESVAATDPVIETEESTEIAITVEGGNLIITEDFELAADAVVDSLTIQSGLFCLNGHKLEVSGDVILAGGTLDIGGGNLLVQGDFCIGSDDRQSAGGAFYMDGTKDEVTVKGEFYFTGSTDLQVTDGRFILHGNFTDAGSGENSFTGNNTIVFSGDSTQIAQSNQTDKNKAFCLNNVVFENGDVTGLNAFKIKGLVDDRGNTVTDQICVGTGVVYAGNIYHGNVLYVDAEYTADSVVTIEGDVWFENVNKYNCEGYCLDVNGDFTWINNTYLGNYCEEIRVSGDVKLNSTDYRLGAIMHYVNLILDGEGAQNVSTMRTKIAYVFIENESEETISFDCYSCQKIEGRSTNISLMVVYPVVWDGH